jgi:hypothetical protein
MDVRGRNPVLTSGTWDTHSIVFWDKGPHCLLDSPF